MCVFIYSNLAPTPTTNYLNLQTTPADTVLVSDTVIAIISAADTCSLSQMPNYACVRQPTEYRRLAHRRPCYHQQLRSPIRPPPTTIIHMRQTQALIRQRQNYRVLPRRQPTRHVLWPPPIPVLTVRQMCNRRQSRQDVSVAPMLWWLPLRRLSVPVLIDWNVIAGKMSPMIRCEARTHLPVRHHHRHHRLALRLPRLLQLPHDSPSWIYPRRWAPSRRRYQRRGPKERYISCEYSLLRNRPGAVPPSLTSYILLTTSCAPLCYRTI